jgi:peroxiredoxin
VQLFDLNEEFSKFEELGATLIAISADTPEVTAEKFDQYGPFSFTVLSDPDNKVAAQYDCFDPATGGREAKQFHGSFVLDSTGVIRWADISDKPFRSTRTLLYEVAKLRGSVPGG